MATEDRNPNMAQRFKLVDNLKDTVSELKTVNASQTFAEILGALPTNTAAIVIINSSAASLYYNAAGAADNTNAIIPSGSSYTVYGNDPTMAPLSTAELFTGGANSISFIIKETYS